MSSFQSPLNTSNEESITNDNEAESDTEKDENDAGTKELGKEGQEKDAKKVEKKKRKSPTRIRRATTGDMNPRDENLLTEICELENTLPDCVTYEQVRASQP